MAVAENLMWPSAGVSSPVSVRAAARTVRLYFLILAGLGTARASHPRRRSRRDPMTKGRISTTLLLGLGVAACGAAAGEKVSFPPVGPPDTPGAVVPAAVPGTLSFPPNPAGRVPAVVIAHDSAV